MTKISTKVVGYTKPVVYDLETPEELIAYCARVSSGRPQSEWGDNYEGLLKYCVRNKHWSVFDMADIVVEVKAPRDIARQVLRHKSCHFQEFCIAGDSKIRVVDDKGRGKMVTIEDLYRTYKSKYWGRFKKKARVWDEASKTLVSANIKEVFDTGVKEVYKLTTDSGDEIKATLDHKFLTFDGFKTLGEIKDLEECFIGMNGQELYRDKTWLKSAKELSISTGTGLQGISDMAGVTTHTIRKWLRIHGLQYTKKEVSSYTEVWNKGLPKEQQPRYGKFCSEDTRDKMRASSRSGEESEFYKGGIEVSWRKKVAAWSAPFRQELLVKQGFKCAVTGEDLTGKVCHVDHIQPVYLRPDLAFDKDNLQVLSVEAHKAKSIKEQIASRRTARWKLVKSVEYFGEVQTYDMEIEHESHNYVANKFITHNSQRYSDQIEYTSREVRSQDTKNRQNSFDDFPKYLKDEFQEDCQEIISLVESKYQKWRDKGAAKECVRVMLPEGLTMSHVMIKGSVRSWLHYVDVRDDEGVTQLEHVWLAREIAKVIAPYVPVLFKDYLIND